ncbi:MAG: divalent-cation tolerance protein CutA [Spirochaetes bacterium]|jgi:periplasmic divalent cation tolerance protein|nr:divalent-cation tolerance protein CutA [Spirochaetota bacterium]
MSGYVKIFCTVPSREVAEKIAGALVGESLAACVNIVPEVVSYYRWKGEVCRDPELLLMIKSTESKFPIIKGRILSLHPYEVPEIVSVVISDGNEKYLDWISEATR